MQYLRRIGSIADLQTDYAIARRARDGDIRTTLEGFADSLRNASGDGSAEQANLAALQWLMIATLSK